MKEALGSDVLVPIPPHTRYLGMCYGKRDFKPEERETTPYEAMVAIGKKYYIPAKMIPTTPVQWRGEPVEPHLIFKTEEECEKYCLEYNKEHYSWTKGAAK